MSTFNLKEYGGNLYADLGVDISTGIDYKVVIEPQIGDKKEFTTNISLGTENITVDDSNFLANQYLVYVFQEDDLDYAGLWRSRGSSVLNSQLIKSDYVIFTVLD